MRTYQADLSRRLGPVFSEMAARAASLGPYVAPVATKEGLLERWNRLRAEDEVCVNLPTSRVVQVMPRPSQAAAYKPAHGGYPTVKAGA